MTREHAAREWPVMKAFAEGAVIQENSIKGTCEWWDSEDPEFSKYWIHRIKPKPVDEAELRKLAKKWRDTCSYPTVTMTRDSCATELEAILNGGKA